MRRVSRPGCRARVDPEGPTIWQPDPVANHALGKIIGDPKRLAEVIESLMVAPPRHSTAGGTK